MTKLIEELVGEYICVISGQKDFLNKSFNCKKKINKCDYIKTE